MSCKIYVEENDEHIHVATLKDRKAAEDYWKLVRENYRGQIRIPTRSDLC